MLPAKDRLTICFAHVAYQLQERFTPRQTGIESFMVRTPADFERRIGEADVVVVSGMWRNELLDKAPRLRFIQSIGAGTDQFDREKLKTTRHPPGERARRQYQRGVRTCDGAHPRHCTAPARGARQSGQTCLAWNDFRFEPARG